MKLIKENGSEVRIGQLVFTFRGELVEILDFTAPHKPSSTGRVYVKFADGSTRGFFPSVVGCSIVS
jgi:hypothetical protein